MSKEDALTQVEVCSVDYDNAKTAAQSARVDLLDAIAKAYDQEATQLEIANRTEYSRQRVAQWLKELRTDA